MLVCLTPSRPKTDTAAASTASRVRWPRPDLGVDLPLVAFDGLPGFL
jgi:hypothetical protein